MQNNPVAMKKTQRLFFGIAVEPWINELTKIQKNLKQNLCNLSRHIAWHPTESLHITLVFLGETGAKLKNEIEQRVQAQLSEFPLEPFEIKVTKLTLLSSRHIIVAIDAPMINRLYEQLKIAVSVDDNLKKERKYYAHLALGKLKDTRIASKVYKAMESIKLDELQPFMVNEFYLYESKPHRQYKPLLTFSLCSTILPNSY